MKKLRKPCMNDGHFSNSEDERAHSFFFRTARIILQSFLLRWSNPDREINKWIGQSCPLSCSIDPVITWIGHASFLIQIAGVNILIDPIFGGLTFFHSRILPAGFAVEDMPKIDYVLISHNHIDHMDSKTLFEIERRNSQVHYLVPHGDKAWFDKNMFKNSYEHMWWDKRSFSLEHSETKKITFSFLPAAHWSQRGLFDRNKSLWGSWMIECSGLKIYFGGDSYYCSHFSEIAQEFPNIDVALLPIGPCEPRELLEDYHMNAKQAGKAFLNLNANCLIPMHWGAFSSYGVESFDAPVNLMQKWWKENKAILVDKRLKCMKVGQPFAL